MLNKTIAQRLWIGFKKGYNTPTLPDHIIKFNSIIYIRIISFLGGISFLIILGKSYVQSPKYIYNIAFIFAIIFTFYHFYLIYYRIQHMVRVIMSDEFDIRNSPLERLAHLGARALFCFKGVCAQAQPIGLTLGIMLGADEILKQANREAVFAPFLATILNSVLHKEL